MPEKTAVFTRCPGQSSLRKPVGFVILAGPYGYEFVRIEPDKVCEAEVFDAIITDWDCVEDQVAALEDKGIQVIVAEEPNE